MNPTVPAPLVRRALVTLGLLALARFLAQLPIPGMPVVQLAQTGDVAGLDPRWVERLGMLGLTPLVTAFVLVELAAQVLPRALREGSRADRRPLRQTAYALAAVLALLQAFAVLRYLSELASRNVVALGSPPTGAAAALVVGVIAATSLAALPLAAAIDRWGVGHGWAWLLAGAAAQPLRDDVARVLEVLGSGSLAPMQLALPLLALVVLVALMQRSLALWAQPGGQQVPVPASGLIPAALASTLVPALAAGAPLLASWLWLPHRTAFTWEDGWLALGSQAAVLVLTTVLLSRAFHPPRAVAALWSRLRPTTAPDEPAVRGALARATLLSAALLFLGAVALPLAASTSGLRLALDFGAVAVTTCAALDLVAEWRFRRTHGDISAVWELHRVYAAAPLLQALEAERIPALAQGVRLRALLHAFGPYLPVRVLVPARDAERAAGLIGAWLAPEPEAQTTAGLGGAF